MATAVPLPPTTPGTVAAPKAGFAAPNNPPAVCVFCPKKPVVAVLFVVDCPNRDVVWVAGWPNPPNPAGLAAPNVVLLLLPNRDVLAAVLFCVPNSDVVWGCAWPKAAMEK